MAFESENVFAGDSRCYLTYIFFAEPTVLSDVLCKPELSIVLPVFELILPYACQL